MSSVFLRSRCFPYQGEGSNWKDARTAEDFEWDMVIVEFEKVSGSQKNR